MAGKIVMVLSHKKSHTDSQMSWVPQVSWAKPHFTVLT